MTHPQLYCWCGVRSPREQRQLFGNKNEEYDGEEYDREAGNGGGNDGVHGDREGVEEVIEEANRQVDKTKTL